jgi:SAM-dependent methyltransferase
MRSNKINPYDIEPHLAEIYDQTETQFEDVALLRELIGNDRRLKILEPFCGTGRIFIPLAKDGHEIVGMDVARSMIARADTKIKSLSPALREKITLIHADVISSMWPPEFDLVILGGNCFYELATADEQEKCIRKAAQSLVPGGSIFIDNDHMEGGLDEEWRKTGTIQLAMMGICLDGTSVESTREIIWVNSAFRLVKFRRWTKVILPDGKLVEKEFMQQKHPVSAVEIRGWLERTGVNIERVFGDYDRSPYYETCKRAIFWARKPSQPGK